MESKVLPFSRVAKPPASSSSPPYVAADYKLYPVRPEGAGSIKGDYVISRALLDLVLLHLVGQASDEQRLALAQEMANLSGIEL